MKLTADSARVKNGTAYLRSVTDHGICLEIYRENRMMHIKTDQGVFLSSDLSLVSKDIIEEFIDLGGGDIFYESNARLPKNEYFITYHGKHKRSKNCYAKIIMTLDVEATTYSDKNFNQGFPFGVIYHWQACIAGKNFRGRSKESLREFMQRIAKNYRLTPDCRMCCFIQNLSYEWDFIKEFFTPIPGSSWVNGKNKPVKIVVEEGFEFRCTYILSNMNLKKLCENTKNVSHGKLVGDLDYDIKRLPCTPMTIQELRYCFNDTAGLYEVMMQKLQEEENWIYSLPLTSTGYVRREAKAKTNTLSYKKFVERLQPDLALYDIAVKMFRGGNTHANRFRIGKLYENVAAVDIGSSYPYQICAKYYPVTAFDKVSKEQRQSNEFLKWALENRCCILHLELSGIEIRTDRAVPIPYIARAKIERSKNVVSENGRILSADRIELYITEIDFEIILSQYDITEIIVADLWTARRGKLPMEIISLVLEYYQAKTELKGVEGKEYEYAKAKNLLNSIFGMMVTNILKDVTMLNDGGEYIEVQANEEEREARLEKYYQKGFLHYFWGVYITAHARMHLQKMIDKIGYDTLYVDTDGVKYLNPDKHLNDILEINSEIHQKNITFDFTLTYYNKKKEPCEMGLFDMEKSCDFFMTWGAKKYLSVYKHDENQYYAKITVAGCQKEKGSRALEKEAGGVWDDKEKKFLMTREQAKRLENIFRIGKLFNDEESGRTVAYRNRTEGEIVLEDEWGNHMRITPGANIGIIKTTYTLGISQEFDQILHDLGICLYD